MGHGSDRKDFKIFFFPELLRSEGWHKQKCRHPQENLLPWREEENLFNSGHIYIYIYEYGSQRYQILTS